MAGWIAVGILFGVTQAGTHESHVLDTSGENMKAIANSLGVKCTHCHIEKESDGKPDFDAPSALKATAILMKVHFVDSLLTGEGEPVSCVTCHAGTARFLPRSSGKPATRLMEGMEGRDIMRVMRGFTKSLGVKCLHCHTKGNDGRMDPTIPTENRAVARFMFERMTSFQRVDGEATNCGSCHAGKVRFLPRWQTTASE